MVLRGVRGVLTFAIGGTVLALLSYLIMSGIGNNGSFGFYVVLLGFLGFLFVGMGLYSIVEDSSRAAK